MRAFSIESSPRNATTGFSASFSSLADLDAGARDELAHDLRDLGRRHEGITGRAVEDAL